MKRSGVIYYLILDHDKTGEMRLTDEVLHLSQIAEMFVDPVEIDRTIPVITGGRFVVVELLEVELVVVVIDGCRPDRRCAERFDVRKFVDNALKITAMVSSRFRTVV